MNTDITQKTTPIKNREETKVVIAKVEIPFFDMANLFLKAILAWILASVVFAIIIIPLAVMLFFILTTFLQ